MTDIFIGNSRLIHGDTLEQMAMLPDGSVDMILADLPYGSVSCAWDVRIPFDKLWEQYKRIARDNSAIILTASQPFTTAMISSNLKDFKYCWVWEKTISANFGVLKWQPAKKHEDVVVFCNGTLRYFPQMEEGKPYTDKARIRGNQINEKSLDMKTPIINTGTRHPSSIIRFPNPNNNNEHPTQKPVKLSQSQNRRR